MHSSKRFSWLLGVLTLTVQAQTPPSSDVRDTVSVNAPEEARWGLSGYGSLNYFAFDWDTDDWDTDPARRNALDVERLVLYPSYRFTARTAFRAEMEFEHGGTGVTKEFDPFEEFGEFETEVEAGGEVRSFLTPISSSMTWATGWPTDLRTSAPMGASGARRRCGASA